MGKNLQHEINRLKREMDRQTADQALARAQDALAKAQERGQPMAIQQAQLQVMKCQQRLLRMDADDRQRKKAHSRYLKERSGGGMFGLGIDLGPLGKF